MDHDEAVRQKATERYLLNELDPEERDRFEDHLFDCQDCAIDVRATAMFIEQSKAVLSQPPETPLLRVPVPVPQRMGWFAWLRPAFIVPALAALLAVIGYQNLVTYPQMQLALSRPQLLPYASLNLGTRGAIASVITARAGEDYVLFLNLPPGRRYSSYMMELYNAAGKKEWSLPVDAEASAALPDDAWPVRVPGAHQQRGDYTVVIRGVNASGESTEIGRTQFALQAQK